jgi:DNA-binding transcriptional regulator GbsR (MarR family)
MTKQSIDKVIDNFIERIGQAFESDGLPRIAGRIMGFFVMHAEPVSFAELAVRLKVSRGSISTNARLLESLGVLARMTMPGDRQVYYKLADSPFVHLIEGFVKRQKMLEAYVKSVQAEIPASMKATRSQLRDMHAFHKAAAEHLQRLMEQIDSK